MFQITILLCSIFVAYSISTEEIADRKVHFGRIKKYESIHINLDQFESNNIIEFDAFNNHYTVQLEVNKAVHPIELRHDEATGTITEHHPDAEEVEYCFHQGQVLNAPNRSLVALSTCRGKGIRGSIHAFGVKLRLNPTSFYHAPLNDMDLSDEHIVYKSTDYDWESEEKEYGELESMQVENYDLPQPPPNTMRRLLGTYSGNGGTAQFLAVIDKTWVEQKGGKSQAKSFLQGAVNLASSYFTNGRIKNGGSVPRDCRIRLEWKYVVYLDVSASYDCTTRHSCLKAMAQIAKQYSSNRDFGFMFARRSHRGGMATTAQICRPGNGVSLSTNNYEQRAAHVFAHEVGHLLGSSHDAKGLKTIMGDNDGDDWTQTTINSWRQYQVASPYFGWGCLDQNNLGSGTDDKLGAFSSGGGGSGGGGGGNSNRGTCCECFNNPSQKTCNLVCRAAVSRKDAWCGSHDWDTDCQKKAKQECSSTFTFTECDHSNTDGSHSLCFYKNGRSEGEEFEPREFQMRDCVDSGHAFAPYQYIMYNGTGRIETEHWLHWENNTDAQLWIISEDTLSTYPLYYCQERDILQCTSGKWAVSYVDDDAVMYKTDENALIVPCQGAAEKNGAKESITLLVVSLVAVAVAIALIALMMWCYMKRKVEKKSAFEEVYEEEQEEEEEEDEDIEVEVELENETQETR